MAWLHTNSTNLVTRFNQSVWQNLCFMETWLPATIRHIAYPEHWVSVILSSTRELAGLPLWAPPHCDMVCCWQINSILANIDRKNSIRILNQYLFLVKYIDMSIVYWFITFFIILEIKVSLISYSLSKVTSKATENNGLISLISPHSAPCWQYPSQSGTWVNHMMVTTANNSYWW